MAVYPDWVLSRFADGFLKGLGTSSGVTLAVAGLVALVAWYKMSPQDAAYQELGAKPR